MTTLAQNQSSEEASVAGIMHVITGLQTGGAETALLKLLTRQRRDGVRLSVVSLRGRGAMTAQIEALGIEVTSLGMRDDEAFSTALGHLLRHVRSWRPSLLQGWMYHGNLAASFAAIAAARSVPVLWNIRHSLQALNQEKRGTRLAIWLGKRLSFSPRAIIYNARVSRKQHVVYGYSDKASLVIPNGFDCDLFKPREDAYAAIREELGIRPDTLLIGMVARFHPIKDFPNFLTAATLLGQQFPEAQFVLVGKGAETANDELRALISSLGAGDRLHLLGERVDVARIVPAFDILSTSSWSEGFPNVLGEAMSCGVPCVATDVGDSAYVLGDTGLVVPPRDPEALAAAWGKLLRLEPEERGQLGAAARRRIRDNFELDAVANQYRDLYASHLAIKDSSFQIH